MSFKLDGQQLTITFGHGTVSTMLSAEDGRHETSNELVLLETQEPHPIGDEDPSVHGILTDQLPGRSVRIRFERLESFRVFEAFFERLRQQINAPEHHLQVEARGVRRPAADQLARHGIEGSWRFRDPGEHTALGDLTDFPINHDDDPAVVVMRPVLANEVGYELQHGEDLDVLTPWPA